MNYEACFLSIAVLPFLHIIDEIIDCCALWYRNMLLYIWGFKCKVLKPDIEAIHLLEAREPTATSCSIKFSIKEDFSKEFLAKLYMEQAGLFHFFFNLYVPGQQPSACRLSCNEKRTLAFLGLFSYFWPQKCAHAHKPSAQTSRKY